MLMKYVLSYTFTGAFLIIKLSRSYSIYTLAIREQSIEFCDLCLSCDASEGRLPITDTLGLCQTVKYRLKNAALTKMLVDLVIIPVSFGSI